VTGSIMLTASHMPLQNNGARAHWGRTGGALGAHCGFQCWKVALSEQGWSN